MEIRLNHRNRQDSDEDDSDQEVRMILDDHTDRAKIVIETKRQITKISTSCKTLDRLLVGPGSQARALTASDTESLRVTLAQVKESMLESARRIRTLGFKLHESHTALDGLIKRREKRRTDNRAAIRAALSAPPGETTSRAKVVAVLTNVNANVTPPPRITPEPRVSTPGLRPRNPPRPTPDPQPVQNDRLLSPRVPRRRVTAPPRAPFLPRGGLLPRGRPALRGGFTNRATPN